MASRFEDSNEDQAQDKEDDDWGIVVCDSYRHQSHLDLKREILDRDIDPSSPFLMPEVTEVTSLKGEERMILAPESSWDNMNVDPIDINDSNDEDNSEQQFDNRNKENLSRNASYMVYDSGDDNDYYGLGSSRKRPRFSKSTGKKNSSSERAEPGTRSIGSLHDYQEIKIQKKSKERKEEKLTRIVKVLDAVGDIVALIHIANGGDVNYYGNSYITRFVKENWKSIEEMPGFLENINRREFGTRPPKKPVSEMNCEEARVFSRNLLTKVLGHKKGFGDLSKKPPWWPTEVDWMTKVFTKSNRLHTKNHKNFSLSDYKAIINAYFDYQNKNTTEVQTQRSRIQPAGENEANSFQRASALENTINCEEISAKPLELLKPHSSVTFQTLPRSKERKEEKMIKIVKNLDAAGDIVALIHVAKEGNVNYYGNPYITRFVKDNWKFIEEMPGFLESINRNERGILPPKLPVSEMNCEEARVFSRNLLTKVLGHKKGFGDLSKKPPWWPTEVDWMTKVFTKSRGLDTKDQRNMVQSDYKAIIKAYFDYQNKNTTEVQPQPNLVNPVVHNEVISHPGASAVENRVQPVKPLVPLSTNIVHPSQKYVSALESHVSDISIEDVKIESPEHKKSFSDISRKPIWWPPGVAWMGEVFNKALDIQAITTAYFDYQRKMHSDFQSILNYYLDYQNMPT